MRKDKEIWKVNWLKFLDLAIFTSNHWIFAWHYLKAACLFKLAFGSLSSYSKLEKLRKRDKFLSRLNLVLHATTLIVFLIMIGTIIYASYLCDDHVWMENCKGRDLILKLCYGTCVLLLIVLACMSLIAMSTIQLESQKLETIGIYANKRLFTMYAIFWGFSSVLFTAWFISYIEEVRQFDSMNKDNPAH